MRLWVCMFVYVFVWVCMMHVHFTDQCVLFWLQAIALTVHQLINSIRWYLSITIDSRSRTLFLSLSSIYASKFCVSVLFATIVLLLFLLLYPWFEHVPIIHTQTDRHTRIHMYEIEYEQIYALISPQNYRRACSSFRLANIFIRIVLFHSLLHLGPYLSFSFSLFLSTLLPLPFSVFSSVTLDMCASTLHRLSWTNACRVNDWNEWNGTECIIRMKKCAIKMNTCFVCVHVYGGMA